MPKGYGYDGQTTVGKGTSKIVTTFGKDAKGILGKGK